MNIPEWTKPALLGAGAGAFALAAVGFTYGGWMTGGAAAEMSEKQSSTAVVLALRPYCLQMSETDPKAALVLADLKNASPYQRRGIVEEAGWATPLGADAPDSQLADSCQRALTKDF